MSGLAVEEALERVLELCAPLAEELVSVEEAVGRAAAHQVMARRTLPPYDNSAVDGYALRTIDLARGPITLEVVERIFAGQRPALSIEEGMCARVMTGAQVPAGADAVVMQERVQVIDTEQVEVLEAPRLGANIRRRGEDIHEGHELLAAGTPIGLAEAGALWGQGLPRVAVRRRPTVTIASCGDELCNPWEEPRGRIVDTNSPVIAQGVLRAGGLPTSLGVAPDRLDAITASFRRGLGSDVLIAIAGASVGDHDFTRSAFVELGIDLDFWKVAMKPGKPLAVGRKDGTLVFALPGNPVSAMVTFELFVRPALRALQGLPPTQAVLPGRLAVDVKKSAGLRHFLRATVEVRGTELWATPLASQSSGAHASAIGATHLISLEPAHTDVGAGSDITLVPVNWGA
jgi:molybdopterin molybdotransferase